MNYIEEIEKLINYDSKKLYNYWVDASYKNSIFSILDDDDSINNADAHSWCGCIRQIHYSDFFKAYEAPELTLAIRNDKSLDLEFQDWDNLTLDERRTYLEKFIYYKEQYKNNRK